jgi:hypothetical protein
MSPKSKACFPVMADRPLTQADNVVLISRFLRRRDTAFPVAEPEKMRSAGWGVMSMLKSRVIRCSRLTG